jgi:hypothetical protein
MLIVHDVCPNNEWYSSIIASMQPGSSLGPYQLQHENMASRALAFWNVLFLTFVERSRKWFLKSLRLKQATNGMTNGLIRCHLHSSLTSAVVQKLSIIIGLV